MTADLATTRHERPVYLPSGDQTLFGVLTEPTTGSRDIGLILMYGGAYNMSANIDQYWARLARRAAAEGLHVLRFDYQGNGDSTGRIDGFDHRKPFDDDLEAAIVWMRSLGLDRFALVGDCLGARACMLCASRRRDVEGLYLLSVLVNDGTKDKAEEWAGRYRFGHYVRRALHVSTLKRLGDPLMRKAFLKVALAKVRQMVGLSRDSGKPGNTDGLDRPDLKVRVSDNFLNPLETLAAKEIRTRFVFGDTDAERKGRFDLARRQGRLRDILEGAGSRIEVTTVPGGLADVPDIEAQDAVIEDVTEWAMSLPPVGAPTGEQAP